jgi:hypothetical protein
MSDLRRLTDLPTTDPAAASAAEVMRLARATIGSQDDAWLIFTHALSRMGHLSPGDVRVVVPATGRRAGSRS